MSIIIPVYNDRENLRRCLEHLRRQTWPADAREILVVDNASTEDLTQVRQEWPDVRWFHEPTPGSYAARNLAIPQARGAILAFIDSDCFAVPEWLEAGIARLMQPGVDIVGGSVRTFARDPQRPTWAELFELQFAFPMETYVTRDRFAGSGNLFTRPEVFARVGPFRADLKSGGDREWGNRAVAAGMRLEYEGRACVEHAARSTMKELWIKRKRTLHGGVQAGKRPVILGPRKQFARWAINELAMPPTEYRQLARSNPELPRWTRTKIIAVASILRYRAVVESLRIRRGKAGPAPRR